MSESKILTRAKLRDGLSQLGVRNSAHAWNRIDDHDAALRELVAEALEALEASVKGDVDYVDKRGLRKRMKAVVANG